MNILFVGDIVGRPGREMIRVGLIIDLMQGRKRWCFEMFCLLLGCGFVGFFAYYAVPSVTRRAVYTRYV